MLGFLLGMGVSGGRWGLEATGFMPTSHQSMGAVSYRPNAWEPSALAHHLRKLRKPPGQTLTNSSGMKTLTLIEFPKPQAQCIKYLKFDGDFS